MNRCDMKIRQQDSNLWSTDESVGCVQLCTAITAVTNLSGTICDHCADDGRNYNTRFSDRVEVLAAKCHLSTTTNITMKCLSIVNKSWNIDLSIPYELFSFSVSAWVSGQKSTIHKDTLP